MCLVSRSGLPPIKKPNWQITTALPEDHAVHQMKAVKESAVKTGVDLTHAYDELTDLQQASFLPKIFLFD